MEANCTGVARIKEYVKTTRALLSVYVSFIVNIVWDFFYLKWIHIVYYRSVDYVMYRI